MKQHTDQTQTTQSLNTETAPPQQGKGISYPSQNSNFISQLKAAQLQSNQAPVQRVETEEEQLERETKTAVTTGDQDSVQAKMGEILKLIRNKMEVEGDLDPTDRGASNAYIAEMVANGLCGGWTHVFMQYPEWVEPIYNAVRSWNPDTGMNQVQALTDFESHLSSETGFQGWEQMTAVLHKVYKKMQELEPTEDYSDPLDWMEGSGQPESWDPAGNTITTDSKDFNVNPNEAAPKVVDYVSKLCKKKKVQEGMIHIESDAHHMALRVKNERKKEKIKKKKGQKAKEETVLHQTITVIETERTGMVKTDNWEDVLGVLDNYLTTENLREISVNTRIISQE